LRQYLVKMNGLGGVRYARSPADSASVGSKSAAGRRTLRLGSDNPRNSIQMRIKEGEVAVDQRNELRLFAHFVGAARTIPAID